MDVSFALDHQLLHVHIRLHLSNTTRRCARLQRQTCDGDTRIPQVHVRVFAHISIAQYESPQTQRLHNNRDTPDNIGHDRLCG